MQHKQVQLKTMHCLPKQSNTKPYVDQIKLRKSLIQNIKEKHEEKVRQSKIQSQQESPTRNIQYTRTKRINSSQPVFNKLSQPIQDIKNMNVSDTDKMLFQKKFKNFLNHRQQYEQQLKRKRFQIIQKRKQRDQKYDQQDFQNEYVDKDQIMQDQKGQNQFTNASEMVAFYQQITFGKKNTNNQTQLYHSQKIQYLFRREQFDYIIMMQMGLDQRDHENQLPTLITSIKKDNFQSYLFDQPAVMMLYSINPYTLGDELAQFQTTNEGYLTFQEFSSFLLLDRQPTYVQYTKQNIQQARRMGRGIKCQPIIAKWIADSQLYDWMIQLFKEVDMLGQLKVQKQVLARKIRKQAQRKRILDHEVIEIININKLITLERVLYELQYSVSQSDKISLSDFQNYLSKYYRLNTPLKDKLIKKLILSGKYDPSYIFILGTQTIEIIKSIFNSSPKFAQYFVKKQTFVQRMIKSQNFKKIKNLLVRSQGNRYVKKQTIQQTLLRITNQGETYLDIEQILDFFTNRGRPRKVQFKIYIANLQLQLARIQQQQRRKQQKKLSQGDFSTSSDDEAFQQSLKQKKTQRRKDKLAAIRASQNFTQGKKFNVTVPDPFSFGTGTKQKTKVTIRQKKLKSMLEQKRKQQDQSMKPFKPKPVPQHVKQNLYQKITKDQERQRKQRLQRFRLESQQKMYPVSAHLFERKKSQSVYYLPSQQYKFIAKPLPWYCQVNLLERIQKQKDQRRQRILEQIINKHNDYDMPEGFKNMIERGQQTQKQKQRRRAMSKTTANDPNCTFNPKITDSVPDFKIIHEHFQIDLQNKKQQKQPIKVQPFSFENRPGRSFTTTQKKNQDHQLKKSKQSQHHKVSGQQDINIPITMKYEALVNLRKKQQQQKQNKVSQQRRAQTVRKMRQQKFAPYVRSVLKNIQHGDVAKSRTIIEQKIKQFKRQQRKRKQQYQQEMINIYTKVFNRPLLVEGQQQRRVQQDYQGQTVHQQSRKKGRSHLGSKQKKNEERDPRGQIQHFAQDYQMPYKQQEQYSKRQRNEEYQEMRRKAIQHPPRNYLMEQPDQRDNQNDENEQQQDYEGQYLSQNGRYTN